MADIAVLTGEEASLPDTEVGSNLPNIAAASDDFEALILRGEMKEFCIFKDYFGLFDLVWSIAKDHSSSLNKNRDESSSSQNSQGGGTDTNFSLNEEHSALVAGAFNTGFCYRPKRRQEMIQGFMNSNSFFMVKKVAVSHTSKKPQVNLHNFFILIKKKFKIYY